MKEQCFFIAYGSGANGKSVFLNIIRDLVGSYGLNIPMDTLMTKSNGSGINNDIARMFGARLVTAMEGEEKQKIAQSLVKGLTGGDKMTARFLFKEFFDFVPELKLWMGTNIRPKVNIDDLAMWRRIHLVPFDVVCDITRIHRYRLKPLYSDKANGRMIKRTDKAPIPYPWLQYEYYLGNLG